MRIWTFVITAALALALFVFGQHRTGTLSPAAFRTVVDLTHTIDSSMPNYEPSDAPAYHARTVASIEKDHYYAREISLPEHIGTHIDAPAHFFAGLWSVDQVPAERLVAPLVVLDVTAGPKDNADYRVTIDDISRWEQAHGQIPLGAVVTARTGWESRWNSARDYRNADAKGTMHFPGFGMDAAKFLVEARMAVGLGIDTLSIDYGPSADFAVHRYVLAHSVYQLENVANLGDVPPTGAIIVVAPMKVEHGSGSPVRLLALVK